MKEDKSASGISSEEFSNEIARWQEWYENLENDLPKDCSTYEKLVVRMDLEGTKPNHKKYGFPSEEAMMKWLELNWTNMHDFSSLMWTDWSGCLK